MVNQAEKFFDIDRFGQIGGGAGGKQVVHLARSGVGTDDDDRRVGGMRVAP